MARSLSNRQKQLLNGYIGAMGISELPESVQDELERMGDYETMWMDTNRYLSDLYFQKMYGKE